MSSTILRKVQKPQTRYNKFGPGLGETLALQTEGYDAAGDTYEFHVEFKDGKWIIVDPISWTDQILICDQVGMGSGTVRNMIIQFDDVRRVWVKAI
jgi:hypothetical protein